MKVQAVRQRNTRAKKSTIKGLLHELNSQLQDYVEALRNTTQKKNS